MNIIRKTKWTLLELFPEQKQTEAAAEEAAWLKAREAEAQAEAEAQKKEAAEAGAGEEEKGQVEDKSVLDKIEAEMASIDLVKKIKSESPKKEADKPKVYDPETHDVPVSLAPEGPRPNGVMVLDYKARGVHLDVQCSPEQVVETAGVLDQAGFCLESVSGVDWIKEGQMEVIYDYNLTAGQFCRVAVRVRLPRTAPSVPTISAIYPGADWHERETHDFFGITFEGHPDLTPLLLPEDADFHPLLKDFTP